ncbi:PEP/pyruvate-binding domain-containing protein [Brachybacterium hainanense]|uniref:PEP/pyruvate-binding domain-containing protein n=1 Tax=Brachybacterium hainanense TaxID=1541174 RepID=A0ABV6RJ30_9MICO
MSQAAPSPTPHPSPLLRSFHEVSRADIAEVGGKAANLGELARAGFPVPPGLVLTTEAYRIFVRESGIGTRLQELASAADPEDPEATGRTAEAIAALFAGAQIPEEVREQVLAASAQLGSPALAVRSSATAEDLEDASFAGQQETFLHVEGEEALLAAVRDCWASLWSARALAYRAQRGIGPEEVALAVVVQEMARADAAGVMFTASPTTGRRDETVISAAWGLGEAVVSGLVDTDDLVVDLSRGLVTSRSTAEKGLEVVPAVRGTEVWEIHGPRRRAEVLSDAQALDLAAWGARITAHYGAPQDIEWALVGTGFVITQARPVVALPPEAGPAPHDWSVPRPRSLYFRGSIVEQMPDPLTPLFADLTDAHVVDAMIETVSDASGRDDVFRREGVHFPTINGYAYYGYDRTALAMLTLRTTKFVPRLVTSGIGGPVYWAETALPRYRAVVAEESARDLAGTDARLLLESAERLVHAGFAYYTAVQTVIPPVVIAETSFTALCRRVRRDGDPRPEVLLLGFDSEPIRAETSLFDLAARAREHPALAEALAASDQPVRERPADVDPAAWQEWLDGFDRHLATYGHATYTLDIAQPVAADTPALLWDVLRMYLRGEGTDPRRRRAAAEQERVAAEARIIGHVPTPLRSVFTRLLRRAQHLAPIREDALAGVGLGWPAARRALLELGRRLVATGAIAEAADVFWLRRAELEDLAGSLDAGTALLPSRTGLVEQRRVLWRGQRLTTPPQLLPQRSALRFVDRWMPSVGEQTAADGSLRGIGGSGGVVTARVRVLAGPEEFREFRRGEILVAAITTPAWTPLFAMAAGVVTDVGGPLSHSSIVAREYGVPAVLGTGSATRTLRTGQLVTVDGGAGTVRPVEDDGSATGEDGEGAPA